MKDKFWQGKRVLITGHTGFKGSWLSLWMCYLGAKVYGISRDNPSYPSMYSELQIGKSLEKQFKFDLKNLTKLETILKTYKPQVIFHLAAQTSVLESYDDPLDSIYSNIIGTSNLLHSIRKKSYIKSVIIVSTDKVYKNNEKNIPFSENDPLGGSDIYSSSKTGADILTQSFYQSFFKNSPTKIAIVRAGNVIGGGDWKKDRLIPDCLKSVTTNKNIILRNPSFTRPWQHVLEPLSGYMFVAKKIFYKKTKNYIWNFGPKKTNSIKVIDITKKIISKYKSKSKIIIKIDKTNKENKYLRLSSLNSNKILGWKPVWNINETLTMTVEWHKAWIKKEKLNKITINQIKAYEKKRKKLA